MTAFADSLLTRHSCLRTEVHAVVGSDAFPSGAFGPRTRGNLNAFAGSNHPYFRDRPSALRSIRRPNISLSASRASRAASTTTPAPAALRRGALNARKCTQTGATE